MCLLDEGFLERLQQHPSRDEFAPARQLPSDAWRKTAPVVSVLPCAAAGNGQGHSVRGGGGGHGQEEGCVSAASQCQNVSAARSILGSC